MKWLIFFGFLLLCSGCSEQKDALLYNSGLTSLSIRFQAGQDLIAEIKPGESVFVKALITRSGKYIVTDAKGALVRSWDVSDDYLSTHSTDDLVVFDLASAAGKEHEFHVIKLTVKKK